MTGVLSLGRANYSPIVRGKNQGGTEEVERDRSVYIDARATSIQSALLTSFSNLY